MLQGIKMKRIGINVPDYGIERYRKINNDNINSILKENKPLIYKEPKQNVFYTPGPDNREIILEKMKKEINSALVKKIDPRPNIY
jgi:hypothetical protein